VSVSGEPGAGMWMLSSAETGMKLTLRASTGKTIVVWRDRDTYCARRAGEASEPEVCLAIDLFEVIAELAGLDLERERDAAEAMGLAEDAEQQLQELDDDFPAEAQRSSS
jgi:hypothetical protein